jgi:O-methyltransferase domain/Domain of unknown function (DUF4062)
MARIYVSSTFKDLKECRDQVIHLLRRMRHEVVAMEDYTAEEQWPVDKCLADVASCDLYVGIFAWRYGFIPPDDNPEKLSITELEYRKAGEAQKHRLISLLDENAPWPRPMIDRDPDRIEDFRKRLGEKHICSFFAAPQEITGLVGPAVHNWAKEHGHIKPGALMLAECGVDGRAEFVAGSFFESVPAGADAYILKSVIHDWDDDRSLVIFKNCREAMKNGARLLIIEPTVPERVGSSSHDGVIIGSDLNMLVMAGGRERTEAEFRALLEASGLRIERIVTAHPRRSALSRPYRFNTKENIYGKQSEADSRWL